MTHSKGGKFSFHPISWVTHLKKPYTYIHFLNLRAKWNSKEQLKKSYELLCSTEHAQKGQGSFQILMEKLAKIHTFEGTPREPQYISIFTNSIFLRRKQSKFYNTQKWWTSTGVL